MIRIEKEQIVILEVKYICIISSDNLLGDEMQLKRELANWVTDLKKICQVQNGEKCYDICKRGIKTQRKDTEDINCLAEYHKVLIKQGEALSQERIAESLWGLIEHTNFQV